MKKNTLLIGASALSAAIALPASAEIIFEDNATNGYAFVQETGGGEDGISGGGINPDGTFGGKQKWCENTSNYGNTEDGACYRWDAQEYYNSIAIDATLYTDLEFCGEYATRKVDGNEALVHSYSFTINPQTGGTEFGRVNGGGNGNEKLGRRCFDLSAADGQVFYIGLYNNSNERNERFYAGPFTITGTKIPDQSGSVTINNENPSSGTVLSASVSDGNGVSSVSYSWDGAGSPTNQATYTVVPADAGNTITVTASYTDNAGYSDSSSDTTNAVASNNAGAIAAITGSDIEGGVLTAGNVSDSDGVGNLTYQWQSNGADVGANQNTYTTQAGDVDSTITVTASYTDNLGFPETVTSVGFGPIISAFTNTVASISIDNDSPTIGSTLTATIDDIDGTPAEITYLWTSASGGQSSTSNTYEVVEGDVGSTISVEASFTDGEGTAESASASTANTVPAGNSPASVSISGTAEVNGFLSAAITDADGYTNPAVNGASFSWTLNGESLENCTSTNCFPSEEGELVVSVSYTDNNGFAEDITSAAVTVAAEGQGNSGGGDSTPANPPAVEAGGCTYNPMARSFDMIFLLMSALGLFYFSKRRRNAAMDA